MLLLLSLAPLASSYGSAPIGARSGTTYGTMSLLGWCIHKTGQWPYAYNRAAGAERAGFRLSLAIAAALASSVLRRYAPGAFESAAAAVAMGGGNPYLLVLGLLGVLFTSISVTRFGFACDMHLDDSMLEFIVYFARNWRTGAHMPLKLDSAFACADGGVIFMMGASPDGALLMQQAKCRHGTLSERPLLPNDGVSKGGFAKLVVDLEEHAADGYERIGFCFLMREAVLGLSAADGARLVSKYAPNALGGEAAAAAAAAAEAGATVASMV